MAPTGFSFAQAQAASFAQVPDRPYGAGGLDAGWSAARAPPQVGTSAASLDPYCWNITPGGEVIANVVAVSTSHTSHRVTSRHTLHQGPMPVSASREEELNAWWQDAEGPQVPRTRTGEGPHPTGRKCAFPRCEAFVGIGLVSLILCVAASLFGIMEFEVQARGYTTYIQTAAFWKCTYIKCDFEFDGQQVTCKRLHAMFDKMVGDEWDPFWEFLEPACEGEPIHMYPVMMRSECGKQGIVATFLGKLCHPVEGKVQPLPVMAQASLIGLLLTLISVIAALFVVGFICYDRQIFVDKDDRLHRWMVAKDIPNLRIVAKVCLVCSPLATFSGCLSYFFLMNPVEMAGGVLKWTRFGLIIQGATTDYKPMPAHGVFFFMIVSGIQTLFAIIVIRNILKAPEDPVAIVGHLDGMETERTASAGSAGSRVGMLGTQRSDEARGRVSRALIGARNTARRTFNLQASPAEQGPARIR